MNLVNFLKSFLMKKPQPKFGEEMEDVRYEKVIDDIAVNLKQCDIRLCFGDGHIIIVNLEGDIYNEKLAVIGDFIITKDYLRENIRNINVDNLNYWEIVPGSIRDCIKSTRWYHRERNVYVYKYNEFGNLGLDRIHTTKTPYELVYFKNNQ